ncbi:MAG: acyl-ACP--UDP-N-acetylglucosamine O-acyltransferase [Phycisphaerales bacterium]
MPSIHPTATIGSGVQVADDASIGPFCVLDTSLGPIVIESGVVLLAHVHVMGPVRIGAGTRIWPYATIGGEPQDVKFDRTRPTPGVTIGQNCVIREQASVHAASNGKDKPTIVGDRVYMMVNAHVGHDAHVSNDCVLVNNSCLGGHAFLGERVILSAGALLHQFCRVGRLGMFSGSSVSSADVLPFCVVWGRNRVCALNVVGMRRAGIPRDDITTVRTVFRDIIRRNLPREQMIAEMEPFARSAPAVQEIIDFARSGKKPLCPYGTHHDGTDDEGEHR